MADTQKMTKEQLEDYIQRLSTREATAALIMMAAGAGLLFSGFATGLSVVFLLCFAVGTTSGVTLMKATLERQRCESDQMRRYPPPPGQVITRIPTAQEAAMSLSQAANDFNPAAATTLDKDIKTMVPLRLKLKAEM